MPKVKLTLRFCRLTVFIIKDRLLQTFANVRNVFYLYVLNVFKNILMNIKKQKVILQWKV